MFLWNIFLALVWAAMNGSFTSQNLIAGFLLGYAVLWLLATRGFITTTRYMRRVRVTVLFLGFFFQELVISNLKLARTIFSRKLDLRPAIVAIPLDAETDEEISILANLLTITPGSLTIDISDHKKYIYVHVLYAHDAGRDQTIQEIKEGLEKRVLEVLR